MSDQERDPGSVETAALAVKRERNDVVAYLRQRCVAAQVVAMHNSDEQDRAREITRQITSVIDAIERGLHEHAAVVADAISMGGGNG